MDASGQYPLLLGVFIESLAFLGVSWLLLAFRTNKLKMESDWHEHQVGKLGTVNCMYLLISLT